MSGEAAGGGAKWPGPVTFDDDDPKKGFAYVKLTIPNMVVKKAFMGPVFPKNAEIKFTCEDGVISVKVSVTNSKETTTQYEYRKNAPEDVDFNRSKFKVKDGQITVELAKVKVESWAQHVQYMIEKPEN